MIKKIALTAVVASALFSSSSYAEENMFYIKGEGAVSFFPSVKSKAKVDNKEEVSAKFKKSIGGSASVGVGYYVMDNLRTELSFKYPFISEAKYEEKENGKVISTATFKPSALGLFLKGYVDVYDFEVGKVSIGAGIGWTQVSGETKSKKDGKEDTTKFNKKNGVGFGAGARVSYNISEGVALEGGYEWTMYGKPKDFTMKEKDVTLTAKVPSIQTHDIVFGLRFAV